MIPFFYKILASQPTDHQLMIDNHFVCQSDPSYINFGTAESTVTHQNPLIQQWVSDQGIDTQDLPYGWLHGTPDMRHAVAQFLADSLSVDASQIVVTTSVAAAKANAEFIDMPIQEVTSINEISDSWVQAGSKGIVFELTAGPNLSFGITLIKNPELAGKLHHQALFSPPSTLAQRLAINQTLNWGMSTPATLCTEDPDFIGQLMQHLVHPHNPQLTTDNLFLMSGSTACLDALGRAICSKGDKIGVPTPYYAGFDADFERSGAEILAYKTENDRDVCDPESLIRWANEQGVKALVVTHPGNPTGLKWSPENLQNLCALAKQNKIHLIVDEIYLGANAGDAQASEPNAFKPTSAMAYMADNPYIHVTHGLAKNFGLAGLKVGWAITQNPDISQTLRELKTINGVSMATQKAASRLFEILETNGGVQNFFEWIYQERRRQYDQFVAEMTTRGVPVMENSAEGVFVMVDLSTHAGLTSFEDELAFKQRFFVEEKVLLTPGQGFHLSKPGWFRVCYAQSAATIEEFFTRFDRICGQS